MILAQFRTCPSQKKMEKFGTNQNLYKQSKSFCKKIKIKVHGLTLLKTKLEHGSVCLLFSSEPVACAVIHDYNVIVCVGWSIVYLFSCNSCKCTPK